jgi:ParB family transcriptional regulator, chromosome partitioning protein
MADIEVMKIELGRLVANTYNPRKRMGEKHLASLKKSLKEDGQLQNLLVRSIEGGKYEVVAGMRRFQSMKKIYDDKFKVMCTVKEMDDATAMIQSYKENIEREELNPIDDAGWFFNMLGLKEGQLFVTKSSEKGDDTAMAVLPLPTHQNPDVIQLSNKIGVTSSRIEKRLPLLALPSELQDLLARSSLKEIGEDETPLGTEKAEAIARLRLIGIKEEAHEHMKSVWKKWGKEDAPYIDDRVTDILKTYKENAEAVMRELETTEANLKKRVMELNGWIEKDVSNWLDPKAKESAFALLPDALKDKKEGVEIPNLRARGKDENDRNYANDEYESLDEFVMELTRNTTLEDANDELELKIDRLKHGKKDLVEENKHTCCGYCGSEMSMADIQKKIDLILEEINEIGDDIKAKDKVRNATEKLKRELGTLIRKYDEIASNYIASLDKLLKAKKITKDEHKEKLEKFKLKE